MRTSSLLLTLSTLSALGGAVTIYKDGKDKSGILDKDTKVDCTYYVTAEKGDTCTEITRYYGITDEQFREEWNPSVGNDCHALVEGHTYCVSIVPDFPHPKQPGVVKGCKQFYHVNNGDSCQSIVDAYQNKFTVQEFTTWNSQTGSGCSLLMKNQWACVGI